MLINGQQLPITLSLYGALVHLRGHRVSHLTERLPLWVDQICIQQSDSKERNHQVSMTGEIYARAARVRIWIETGIFKALSSGPSYFDTSSIGDALLAWSTLSDLTSPEKGVDSVRFMNLVLARDKRAFTTVKQLVEMLGRPYWHP